MTTRDSSSMEKVDPNICPHCGAPIDDDDAGDCGWAPDFIRDPITKAITKRVDDEIMRLSVSAGDKHE